MARMTRTIVSIPEDEKRWLEDYGKKHRMSSAEVIRRAIDEYRRSKSGSTFSGVLRETAGAWTSLKGDSQAHVDRLREEWDRKK